MKKKMLLFTAFAGITALTLSSYSGGPFNGGAGNRTGSAGTTANCSNGGCHSANTTATTAVIFVAETATPTTPVSSYVPGRTYKINIGATNASGSLSRFGFQLSGVRSSATSTQAGSFSVGSATNIAVRTSGTLQLVEHTTSIAAITTGVYGVSFDWTAPAAGAGRVKFFGMVNVVNFNGAVSGDAPNAATLELPEAGVSVAGVQRTIGLAAYPSPVANMLHLDIKDAGAKAYTANIIDMSGRTVKQEPISGSKATIDVSSLSAGHYTVMVSGGDATGNIRFIKQ